MALIDDLKKYYANLLIIQYNGKKKAKSTIELLTQINLANMALLQIRDAFNWKTAQGEALDIIGKWVGVDRYVSTDLFASHSWISLIDISGATSIYQGGFSEVSNFNTEIGGFLTPDLVNTKLIGLTDDNFRFLIGLKIIKNSISHCCKDIDDAIYKFYDGKVYTKWDLANKQLIYYFPSEIEEIMEVAVYKGVLPCPPTCNIKLEEYI